MHTTGCKAVTRSTHRHLGVPQLLDAHDALEDRVLLGVARRLRQVRKGAYLFRRGLDTDGPAHYARIWSGVCLHRLSFT